MEGEREGKYIARQCVQGKRLLSMSEPDVEGWITFEFEDGFVLLIRTDDAIVVVHPRRQ